MIGAFVCNQYLVVGILFSGYLLGSVPFGLIIAQLLGHKDLRKHGSGNIGATNALRTGGKLLGALTLIFDSLKGVVAVYLADYFCHDYFLEILVGGAAILGHIFPVWLNYKGGKGVATALAVIAALNWHVGLCGYGIWLATLAITRISFVSALVAFALLPVISYFMTYNVLLVIYITLVSILVIVRHQSNIKTFLTK